MARILLAQAFVGLVWSVAFGSSEGLHGDEIAMLDMDDAPVGGLVAPEFTYHKIPGLLMSTNSRVVKGAGSFSNCQKECNRQPLCKSFSFDPKTSGCVWSSDHLQYDPDFVMALKPTSGKGSYEELPGMTFHKQGWMKSSGKTKASCEELCNKGKSCEAYAFRARDNLCMVSGKSIGMNEHWDYYERDGVAETGFPDKPKDAGAQTSPAPMVPEAVQKQIEKEQSMLNLEKEEVEQTKAKAAEVQQQAALQMKALGDKKHEEGLLKQRLAQVKEWAKSELEHQKEESKIKERAAEVGGKADAIKQQNAEASKQAEQMREKEQAAAKTKADAEISAAKQTAALKLERDQVANEKSLAEAAIAKAKSTEEEAKKQVAADKIEIAKVKASAAKRDEEYHKQLSAEKESTMEKEGKIHNAEKASLARAESDQKQAVADAKRKAVAEMENKAQVELTEVAESQQKADTKENDEKQLEKEKDAHRKEQINDLKKQVEEQRNLALKLQKQIAGAQVEQKVAFKQAEMKKTELSAEAQNKIGLVKLEAERKEQEVSAKLEATRSASQERVRKTQRSKAQQMVASKEGAHKYEVNNEDVAAKVAKEGLTQVKEVSQKASKLPEAEGNEMLEKAKASFRHRVEMAENAPVIPTRYSRNVMPNVIHSVESPVQSLLELGEGVTPAVEKLAQSVWPLDKPFGKVQHDPALGSEKEYRLAESMAAQARGYLSAQSGDQIKVSYIKFPVQPLEEGEVLHGASLELNKVSGPESPATVAVTGCDYHQDEVTFETRPATVATLTSNQHYSAANGDTRVALNPGMVSKFLSSGHLCLEIGGGGKDEPVLYNSPQVKLDIVKPPPPKPEPISLKTGVVMESRRRTPKALAPVPPKENKVQELEGSAKQIKEEAEAQVQPELQHEMESELGTAIGEEKEKIAAAMTKADRKALRMKQSLIDGDRIMIDEITNEEEVKANHELQEDIDSQLEGKIKERKSHLRQDMEKELKDSITNKYEAFEKARLAEEYPKEIEKTLVALKHEKLENFEKTPLDKAKMAAEVKDQLTQYAAGLDLSQKAAKYADYKINMSVKAAVASAVAEALPGQLEAKAKSEAQKGLQAAVNRKKEDYIMQNYQIAYDAKIAEGGAEAEKLQAQNREGDAARASLKRATEAKIPANFDSQNRDAIFDRLVQENEDRFRDEMTKSLTDAKRRELTREEKAKHYAEYQKSYMATKKASMVAEHKKALEEEYKQAHYKKEVDQAEEAGSLVTEAEMEQLQAEVKKKLANKERVKTQSEIADEYKEKLESPDFEKQYEARAAALPQQVLAQLKSELKPGYMAAAQTRARQRIQAKKAEKKEELAARMDAALEKRIEKATATSVLEPRVREQLSEKLKANLEAQAVQQARKKIMAEGIDKKIAKATQEQYLDGTKKEALLYVSQHFEPAMRESALADAQAAAERTATIESRPVVEQKKKEAKAEILADLQAEGRQDLEDKIADSVQGLSDEDAMEVKKSLSEDAEKEYKRKAEKIMAHEEPEIVKDAKEAIYQREIAKERKHALDQVENSVKSKAEAMAQAAVSKKTQQLIDQAEEPEKAAPTTVEINPAQQAKDEQSMVASVGSEFSPAPKKSASAN